MNKETKKVFDVIAQSSELINISNKNRNFKDFYTEISKLIVNKVNSDNELKKLDRKKINLLQLSKELF